MPFSIGDVFVSVADGKVQWRDSAGAFIATLDTGLGGFTTGMAFDSSGNLYVTNFSADTVSKFDNDGNFIGTFGTGYSGAPESIVFDSAGNAYVGQAGGDQDILKFDAAGNLLASFDVPVGPVGSDWIDLSADQCTMLYTSEGTNIRRYDVCMDTALTDFNATLLTGSDAFALRIRQNGEVLVADSQQVVRLDASGNQIQQYTISGEGNLFALNLDPDGTSFWTADFGTANVYKIDIATGAVLLSFNTGTGPTTVFGLAVFGEQTAAQCNTCLCNDRVLPFSCTVDFPPLNCAPSFVDIAFEGVCPSLECFTGQCQKSFDLEVCENETLTCCITLDTINFTGTVDLIFDVFVDIGVDCPTLGTGPATLMKDLVCFDTLNISQTCFACPGAAVCPEDFCDLFDITYTTHFTGTGVVISGTLTFDCP